MRARIAKREFDWGSRVYVMGVINVTPDSFSGDGIAHDVARAVQHAQRLVDEGADIVDIGGESTRPGHTPVDEREEIERVVPVIEELAREIDVPISVDTSKLDVASAAVSAGATIVNDIWGLRRSPGIAELAAHNGCGLVVMHNRDEARYDDLMREVREELQQSVSIAVDAGVPREKVIVDPGIGFGKTWEHNLVVLRSLQELNEIGQPLLVGASRKSFIGRLLDGAPPDQRLEGSLAAAISAALRGADIVRVHDVRETVRALRVAQALR